MLNSVNLIGRLGGDPETRYTQGGSAITTISVATTERWKDKATGNAQERTEWHRVKFFGKLAEIAGEFLTKGALVFIAGAIRCDKYTDKQGNERTSFDIVASDMKMLERRGDGAGEQRPTQAAAPRHARPESSSARASSPASDEFHDDDIPF